MKSKSLSRHGACPGAVAFKLYDTYGLALDEQEEMARERGLSIDREGFEREMNAAARARARELERRREGRGSLPPTRIYSKKAARSSSAMTISRATPRVIGLLVDQQPVEHIEPGMRAELVLDQTPFYAETGGQVGDRGALYSADRREAG